ncbi:hypothetical protein EON63_22705 [archaeon]|nr:MAG: hypothetical protein EON63_22705 [archaeon]
MSSGGVQKEKNKQFFRVLAICHDVIAEKLDGKVKLSASSPDDEALVCAADYFGYSFTDRRDKYCIVYDKNNSVEEEIEVLNIIEFSSKRKRMSVIIRDMDHSIKILTKGADTVMLPRLRGGQDALVQKTERDMVEFSVEGLRCLYIAQNVLKEKDYLTWAEAYKNARYGYLSLDMVHGYGVDVCFVCCGLYGIYVSKHVYLVLSAERILVRLRRRRRVSRTRLRILRTKSNRCCTCITQTIHTH